MKQLLLFKLPKKIKYLEDKALKDKKSTKKIDPKKRKIYNNVYRAKRKGIEIKSHLRIIYCKTEEVDALQLITQVKNLIKLGFVIQTTI